MTVIPLISAGKTTRTTCPYCGVGCGVAATVTPDAQVSIAGDRSHPSSLGRLCVKGSALGETVGLDGRLLSPQARDAEGELQTVPWPVAVDRVAEGFRRIIDEHGPDAVALYVSGQLLTEDYYVANKLMKGYVGSANIDTNSRLCMSSAVAGHKRAFGEDLVPLAYDDLDLADLVVLVGSNTAWCHPILYQRIVRAKQARPDMKIVVIDPRRTATCELADQHLPVKPGTDVALFNGLLSHLSRSPAMADAYVQASTRGWSAALDAAQAQCDTVEDVARQCGLDPEAVTRFYQLFTATEKTITAFSQGVNQSSAGTDKVNAIINCHLVTARLGRPGMGPFSLTGQPNAMGGREVGGLSNMLAAHMDLERADHRELVQAFWESPTMAQRPGLKAVDLFSAIESGRVKAVWIMGTNPVVSLPDADQARRALERCELVVVSDIVTHTDTNLHAHVLLPALGWGEKDGTVTNSERRISRQRAFLPAPGEARADWDIICAVARRMGYRGFDFTAVHEIFDEHARLSACRNTTPGPQNAPLAQGDAVPRVFHIGGLAGLDRGAYDALAPVQWPVVSAASLAAGGTARLLDDGRFAHADGRARFVPTPVRAPAFGINARYPLVLNSGRVRDQWHTMTRTGKSPRLASHIDAPFVEMHPEDADALGLGDGAWAMVSSRWGSLVARTRRSPGMRSGDVFVPIHWNDQFASRARVGAVVNPAVDPVSGEPEFKHTPVNVQAVPVAWSGFVLSRDLPALSQATHWTRIQGRQHLQFDLAGPSAIDDPETWARELLGATTDVDWLDYQDAACGVYRAAYLVDDRLQACVFLSTTGALPSRAWLASLFEQEQLDDAARGGLLVGQALAAGPDAGPTVCACFGVGRNTICDAIRDHKLSSAAQVTACVKAGGNCGSCVPEIRQLLNQVNAAEPTPSAAGATAAG